MDGEVISSTVGETGVDTMKNDGSKETTDKQSSTRRGVSFNLEANEERVIPATSKHVSTDVAVVDSGASVKDNNIPTLVEAAVAIKLGLSETEAAVKIQSIARRRLSKKRVAERTVEVKKERKLRETERIKREEEAAAKEKARLMHEKEQERLKQQKIRERKELERKRRAAERHLAAAKIQSKFKQSRQRGLYTCRSIQCLVWLW